MKLLIHICLFIPFIGFAISLAIRRGREANMARLALVTMIGSLISIVAAVSYWLVGGGKPVNVHDLSLYDDKAGHFHFFLDFFMDRVTSVYLLVGATVGLVVVAFSRRYMHREHGYGRFFNTILFFYFGYVFTVLAGNLETLFMGWEMLGISSFLLIAFYRLRYMPVANAIKVFSIYRLGDVGMLLTMWMSHHLLHENVAIYQLNFDGNQTIILDHYGEALFLAIMIILAASAKSAQLPFSGWLPRAMEGPTPSSAIFYGALSVHAGVFLLLRTFPFWKGIVLARVLIGAIGLATAIVGSLIASTQSTIKGQVAYSALSQIGIMFIEVALGLEMVALFHFAGNAFLRTYQLLVSPSSVAYYMREQFYHYALPVYPSFRFPFMRRAYMGAYLFSIREWNLDILLFKLIFKPLKKLGKPLWFIRRKSVLYILLPVYALGIVLSYTHMVTIPYLRHGIAVVFGILALAVVVKSYNERASSRLAWILLVMTHFFIHLAISFNLDQPNFLEAVLYLGGVSLAGVVGYWCLDRVRVAEGRIIDLNGFHGLVRKHRFTALIFLLCCLGLTGFPITTTYLGEDLMLAHIDSNQYVLATVVSLSLVVLGIAAIRVYARVFLGKLTRDYHNKLELTY
jgi:NADH:ubiquinone oxidoreductase subunit 5 (subunit L)/multisubunit Na+/H+ antiporter MnhA subunit